MSNSVVSVDNAETPVNERSIAGEAQPQETMDVDMAESRGARNEELEELKSAEKQLERLKELCAKNKEGSMGVRELMDSLGCASRLQLVQIVEDLVEKASVLEEVQKCTGWSEGDLRRLEEKQREVDRLLAEQAATKKASCTKDESIPGMPCRANAKYNLEGWARVAADIESLDAGQLHAVFKEDIATARDKAKAQYEALSSEIRHGSYEGIVTALSEANRVEANTKRVVALGKLRKLRKPEAQSVAEYCVELERLSARAYPEMDERALATTRAQQLYDQIVHWPESYYFLEAMEQERSNAYESLKEAAMRVERRRITLESTRSQKYQAMNDSFSRRLREEKSGETKLKEQGLRKDRPKVRQEGESPDKEKEDSKQPTKNEYIRCYNCKEHQPTQNLAQQHQGMAVPQVGRKSITKESGNREITLKMYVSAQKGYMLVLGTNALQALHYELVQRTDTEAEKDKDLEKMPPGVVEESTDIATVCKRTYVAPGQLKWIPIKGQAGERILHSRSKWISSGLCVVNEHGEAEVPVWNMSAEPLVLRVNQEVGDWEGSEAEYSKVRAREVETDMLALGKPMLHAHERKTMLGAYLENNRGEEAPESSELVEDEYEVSDSMHFLHVQFRCDGQPFPAIEGRAGFQLNSCRCSRSTYVKDLLPDIPPPALDERVECVLDAARVLSIWWDVGSISLKVQRIMDRSYKVLKPKAVGFAYAFFRHRCLHVAIMAGSVPQGAPFRHTSLYDWICDSTRIIEYGWRIAKQVEWPQVALTVQSGQEHNRIVLVIPEVLHRIKHCLMGPNTIVFYYKSFRDVKATSTAFFADDVGNVVYVLPPKEPTDPFSWLQFVNSLNLWLTCGAHVTVVNGPRSVELHSWDRLNEKARSHMTGYLNTYPAYMSRLHYLIPSEPGVLSPTMACLKVGVVHDPNRWWAVEQATEFYEFLRQQVIEVVQLEPLRIPK
ncbi:hypothetical protein GCK32_006177 [Trichostrongylus colubriformis]|uniref:Uncharacterized protein n=1 Tax=Trichostrongylus colubriformis TaxID=6319 RepID=A0AAN8IFN2_TRICO